MAMDRENKTVEEDKEILLRLVTLNNYWPALATAPAETSAEAKEASIIAFSSLISFFSLH
jgi:hypothetical protein